MNPTQNLDNRLRRSIRRQKKREGSSNLKVLDHLAEADAAGVGADGHADLVGHEVDGEDVVEATHPR